MKASFECKCETIKQHAGVKAAAEKIYNQTKRNFRKDRNRELLSVTSQQARRERREAAITGAQTLFRDKPTLLNGLSVGIEASSDTQEGGRDPS